MTVPCFVDANVLVYAHNPAEAMKCSVARDLLQELWADLSGRTSVQALNEFYAVITRKLSGRMSPDDAWAEVEEFFRWNPRQIDVEVLRQARQIEARYKLNWWDSLIVAAAQLQGCSLLYTEDLQHGATFDGVRVVNPFISQSQEEPGPYRVEPVSRHRPRGRPRKQAATS
jgi:predicted nucleic acid-binding protein